MDPVQIPVPSDVSSTPAIQTPTTSEQDDLFDKFLKKLVAFVEKIIKRFDTPSSPTVPLGVPHQIPESQNATAPQTILGNIGSTIGNVADQAVKVASQAVNVAGTGVNSVVKGASEYIAEPVTPTPTVDIQDFLSQNYQSTPTVSTPVETTPEVTSNK